MIVSTKASYADFGFIQDKGGCMNIRVNLSLSSKVTSKLKDEVAMTII
jgi:hypothetical protein